MPRIVENQWSDSPIKVKEQCPTRARVSWPEPNTRFLTVKSCYILDALVKVNSNAIGIGVDGPHKFRGSTSAELTLLKGLMTSNS